MKLLARVLTVASFAYAANAATCTCELQVDNTIHAVYVNGVDQSSAVLPQISGWGAKTLAFECDANTRFALKAEDVEAGCANGGFAMACTSTDTTSQWHGFKTGQGTSQVKQWDYSAGGTPAGWYEPDFDDSGWLFANQQTGGDTSGVTGCGPTTCGICGNGNKWLFRLPPLGTGKCSCTYTFDNNVQALYIDGVDNRLRVSNWDVSWNVQQSIDFQCSDDTVFAIKGSDAEGGCATGGYAMYCTSTDTNSVWNGYTTGLDAGVKVHDYGTGTPSNWFAKDFDDSSWADVAGGLGASPDGSGCLPEAQALGASDCHICRAGSNQWLFRLTPPPPTGAPNVSPTGSPTTAEEYAQDQVDLAFVNSPWSTGRGIGGDVDTVYMCTDHCFKNELGSRNKWAYAGAVEGLTSVSLGKNAEFITSDGRFDLHPTDGVTFTDDATSSEETFPWDCACAN